MDIRDKIPSLKDAKDTSVNVVKKTNEKLSDLNDTVIDSSIIAIETTDQKLRKKPTLKQRRANRKVFSWLFLACALMLAFFLRREYLPIYSSNDPAEGGVYIEGSTSKIGNLNPLFATEDAEKSVTKLVFSSLFEYNSQGELVGDLAESIKPNEDNDIYTVVLRQDAYWHDGEQVTSEDVVTTYDKLQHPDTGAVNRGDWLGVKAQAIDDFTVTFALSSTYSPFPSLLTNSILPDHIFNEIAPNEVRLNEFSQAPTVGSGPFKFERLEDSPDNQQVDLSKNQDYYGQIPNIDEFIIRTYKSNELLVRDYEGDKLSAIYGLSIDDLRGLMQNEKLTDGYRTNFERNAATFVFLKNNDDILKESAVRKALSLATNRSEVVENSLETSLPIFRPILSSQNVDLVQSAKQSYDEEKAIKTLEDAGWVLSGDVRQKDGEKLSIKLHAADSKESSAVANTLKTQWESVGFQVTLELKSSEQLNQENIIPHDYQAILFGFEMTADPDVFSLWHSAQSGTSGVNLSELKSTIIDESLEAGRTRADDELRQEKYTSFIDEWIKINPAIALYRPNFAYITKDYVSGVEPSPISSIDERLNSVENWSVD